MQSELDHWTQASARAKGALEQATAVLKQRQEVKRRLSERLFKLLLDSEDSREERLQDVARSLDTLTQENGDNASAGLVAADSDPTDGGGAG